jgi:hypothetical protein
VGQLGRDPTLIPRVTSWFEPARFRVTAHPEPWLDPRRVLSPDRDAILFVWVTLNAEGIARLYFATLSHRPPHSSSSGPKVTYLVRDLRLDHGLDEIGAERIAEVLHLSAVALLEGQTESQRDEVERTLGRDPSADAHLSTPAAATANKTAGMTAEAIAPRAGSATAETARVDRDPNGARNAGAGLLGPFSFGIGYGASSRGDEGIGHGPRGSIGIRFSDLLAVRAMAQWALSRTVDLGDVSLRVSSTSIALAGALRQALGRDLAIEWLLGPSADVVTFAPVGTISGITPGQGDTQARPNLVGGASLVLGRGPYAAILVQASLAATKTHYDVVLDGVPHTIGRPAMLTPLIGAEVEF